MPLSLPQSTAGQSIKHYPSSLSVFIGDKRRSIARKPSDVTNYLFISWGDVVQCVLYYGVLGVLPVGVAFVESCFTAGGG